MSAAVAYEEEELQAKIRVAPPKLIGARIKRARKALDQTLDVFAAAIGTNRSHIIKLEKGDHRPQVRTLIKIASHTGRDPIWFLDPEVDPSPFPDDREPDA